MSALFLVLLCLAAACTGVLGFGPARFSSSRQLQRQRQQQGEVSMLFDGPLGTPEYAILALGTLVPSLAFVKFVGDASDSSRGSLSSETQERFRRTMMEQPGANLSLPTSEEEALKKAIAKAYMQDKDVDVAVLEQKLRKRAEWRKQMLAEQKAGKLRSGDEEATTDDDGW